MESKIQESTFLAEGRAYIVYIRFELDPYDWYELKASDAWKEVERMVEDFGSRDNLIRRLEALDLKERNFFIVQYGRDGRNRNRGGGVISNHNEDKHAIISLHPSDNIGRYADSGMNKGNDTAYYRPCSSYDPEY